MKKRILGKSGFEVTTLGLGCIDATTNSRYRAALYSAEAFFRVGRWIDLGGTDEENFL